MRAHTFIEENSLFEEFNNRSEEVVPINIAHEAIEIAKGEVYQEVLTLLNGGDTDLKTILTQIKHKIK